ncbi:MAG: hypothetical protein Q8N17_20530, partial [Burkholderiaceae bacterium]|nr:hypothetical protein [Burkholderiaceae bacterium]
MRHRALVFGSTLLLGMAVLAQPPEDVQSVTLSQALQAARVNMDVTLAGHALSAARADVLSADHAPVPVMSAKLGS